jgi:hypothetical protein
LFGLRLKVVDLLEKLLEKFLETGQGMVALRWSLSAEMVSF